MNGNVIRTITIRGQAEGLDKLTADVNKLAAAQENVAVVSEQSARRVLSLEDAWKRQTLKLDEAARAQANIARETRIADQALREGLATQQQYAERLNLISQRYGQATTSAKQMIAGMSAAGDIGAVASNKMIAGMSSGGEQAAKGIGLARHELINLSRQAQDVGVSLASGQSPLMVLMQQGSQIADVFIASGKSIGSFFSQAIEWATAFAKTPAGIVTGIVAIGAAAVYAASQFFKSSTTIEEALKEQKRLMDETKTAIGDLIDAQLKLQSTDLKRFQSVRSELDLRNKLKEAVMDIVEFAPPPSLAQNFPGELGAVPPEMVAGYEKITAAVERLNAAREAGQPGLTAFINELGRVGQTEPEFAKIIEKMVKAAEETLQLEASWLKARAALQSVAQVNLANLQNLQAAEGAERMAKATLELAAMYPGMSIEAVKQLDALAGQLKIAQARTGAEELNAQQLVTQNELKQKNLTLEDRIAIAAARRAVTQEQINASAEQQLKNLQNEYELIRATTEEEKNRIRARQEYQKLVDAGTDPRIAGAIESQMRENARAQDSVTRSTTETTAAQEELTDEAKSYGNVIQNNTSLMQSHRVALDGVAYAWNNITDYMQDYKFSLSGVAGAGPQFNPAGYESTYDPLMLHGNAANIFAAEAAASASRTGGESTADRFAKMFDANTDATKENTAATQTMTDVLSPFYSSDPRSTHLGFRAFAGGGIMTPHGELPLKQYQGGGVANSPQVAVYGEGSTPEAYVPVPAGRIPVEIRQPANSNQRPVNVTINVMGNADGNTVAALKSTAFQQAQAMRRAMG